MLDAPGSDGSLAGDATAGERPSTGAPPAGGGPTVARRVRRPAGRPLWPSSLLWLALLAATGAVGVQDVGVQNQMALALAGMAALLAIRLLGLSRALRTPFLLIAAFLTVRYLGWRVGQTLPGPGDAGFVPGVLLFAAELYGIAMYFFGLFVNLQPMARPARAWPDGGAPAALPTVDVLVPSYNEGADLLERTLIAAQAIRYPAGLLRVHLLDDGGTDAKRRDRDPAKARAAQDRHERLRALCAELGVTYLTRARNEHAKAGNINAALARTSGELVLILDADHVPTADFLEATVGHFLEDDKLFLVQTPHHFVNPDPIERNLGTFDRMPGENEMFYAVGQHGLDFWNGSFFCGSAALLRRACLAEVGGIQTASITEDAETALELHARGYRSAYVGRPMVAGLQPETFGAFIGQRTRWAQGMVQILLLKRPFLKAGLTPAQRVCYVSNSFYWLFPLARLLFLLTPLAYLVFGLRIFEASFDEFLAYGVAHLLASLMLANLLFGHVRWPFVSEVYEIAQAPFLAPAILSVFLRPRAPTFKVTAKAETLERRVVSHLARPLLALLGLLVAAECVGAWRWSAYPLERESLAIVLAWNAFNMLFVMAALGATYEQRQVRGEPRTRRDLPAVLELGGRRLPALVADLSAGGARLLVAEPTDGPPLELGGGADALLEVAPEAGAEAILLRLRVRYAAVEGDRLVLGAAFAPRDVADRRAAVRLVFGSSAAWAAFQEGRQGSISLLAGLWVLASLAFAKGGPAIVAALTERSEPDGRRRGGPAAASIAAPALRPGEGR